MGRAAASRTTTLQEASWLLVLVPVLVPVLVVVLVVVVPELAAAATLAVLVRVAAQAAPSPPLVLVRRRRTGKQLCRPHPLQPAERRRK